MSEQVMEPLAVPTCPECPGDPPEMERVYRKVTRAGGDHYEAIGYVCPAGHCQLDWRPEDGAPVNDEGVPKVGELLQFLHQVVVVAFNLGGILAIVLLGDWGLFFAFPVVISFIALELVRDRPGLPRWLRLPWVQRFHRWVAATPGFIGVVLGVIMLALAVAAGG